MEMQQINLNSKLMINDNTIKHLIDFVRHLEEKLLSVKIIHDRLIQLMSIVSNTNENILQDLTNIKTFLSQTAIEREEDEIIPIDPSKIELDDDDDEDIRQRETRVINSSSSSSSNDSLLTNKRSSNLKKHGQTTAKIKSPKSVSFSLNENPPNQQQKRIIPKFETSFPKEKKTLKLNEFPTPINPSLPSDYPKQNQPPKIQRMLTNIRIHEIESKNGDYLRLLNLSNSDDYDLSEHFLQQNIYSKVTCRYRFPFNTIIKAGQTLTIWCGRFKGVINPQPPYVLLWKEQLKWETKPECITILAKPNGQSIAWYQNCHRIITDQSSSDILHVHAKTNLISSDASSSSTNNTVLRPSTKQYRLSAFNGKSPFTHSTNNPIHPDHNGTNGNLPNDLRSQMHQKNKVSQLLNRPKSSSLASHMGCKRDLIHLNLLQNQTTVKN